MVSLLKTTILVLVSLIYNPYLVAPVTTCQLKVGVRDIPVALLAGERWIGAINDNAELAKVEENKGVNIKLITQAQVKIVEIVRFLLLKNNRLLNIITSSNNYDFIINWLNIK